MMTRVIYGGIPLIARKDIENDINKEKCMVTIPGSISAVVLVNRVSFIIKYKKSSNRVVGEMLSLQPHTTG